MDILDGLLGMDAEIARVLGAVLVVYLVFVLLLFIFSVVSYILSSVGMYTIAKRRGIQNPWLAWIPLGNVWILGSIADQFQYVVNGRIRNRRKVLLGLGIVGMLGGFLVQVVNVVMTIAIGATQGAGSSAAALAITLVLSGLALFVVAIVSTIYQYISYHNLFTSCKPQSADLYLVLSIVVSFTLPILIFICRNKDEGMPPKKAQVVTQPVYIPQPVVVAQPEQPSAEVPPVNEE